MKSIPYRNSLLNKFKFPIIFSKSRKKPSLWNCKMQDERQTKPFCWSSCCCLNCLNERKGICVSLFRTLFKFMISFHFVLLCPLSLRPCNVHSSLFGMVLKKERTQKLYLSIESKQKYLHRSKLSKWSFLAANDHEDDLFQRVSASMLWWDIEGRPMLSHLELSRGDRD